MWDLINLSLRLLTLSILLTTLAPAHVSASRTRLGSLHPRRSRRHLLRVPRYHTKSGRSPVVSRRLQERCSLIQYLLLAASRRKSN